MRLSIRLKSAVTGPRGICKLRDKSMRERIKELEKAARALEPDGTQRAGLLDRVNAYAEEFIQAIPHVPAYVATEDGGRGLYDSPITEAGIGLEAALALLKEHVDRPGLNPTSGRF